MKKVQYTFTDGKSGFYSCIANDTDKAENTAFNKAKNELSKYNMDLPSPCKLYSIVDIT